MHKADTQIDSAACSKEQRTNEWLRLRENGGVGCVEGAGEVSGQLQVL